MKHWLLQSILKIESLAVGLLVLSLLSVVAYQTVRREVYITSHSDQWNTKAVDDRVEGGDSFTEDLSDDQQMRFAFKTVDTTDKAFALFLLLPSEQMKNMDLDWFESVTLKAHVEGDSNQQFFLMVRDRVDHLFDEHDYSSRKSNEAFFELTNSPQTITIARESFTVPRWWVEQNAVMPEDSVASFNRIEWLEIAVCDPQIASQGTVVIEEICFTGPVVSAVSFYQGLFASWLMLASLLSYRFFRKFQKKRALRKVRLRQVAQMQNQHNISGGLGKGSLSDTCEIEKYDSLTQLLTEFGLQESIEEALLLVRKGSDAVSLILFDVDDLELLNSTTSRATGDLLLQAVAKIAAQEVGDQHVLGRLRSDKFLVICNNLDRNATKALACSIRSRIETETEGTCSFGVHQLNPINTFEESIDRASKCIREAKFNGKNKVVLFNVRLPSLATQNKNAPSTIFPPIDTTEQSTGVSLDSNF